MDLKGNSRNFGYVKYVHTSAAALAYAQLNNRQTSDDDINHLDTRSMVSKCRLYALFAS